MVAILKVLDTNVQGYPDIYVSYGRNIKST